MPTGTGFDERACSLFSASSDERARSRSQVATDGRSVSIALVHSEPTTQNINSSSCSFSGHGSLPSRQKPRHLSYGAAYPFPCTSAVWNFEQQMRPEQVPGLTQLTVQLLNTAPCHRNGIFTADASNQRELNT
jgi:hypothetical protein